MEIFAFIETFYNRRQLRKHPAGGYLTPLEIRQRHEQGGLRAEPDTRRYPTGQNPATWQVDALPLTRDNFHGDWNYTLHPASAPEPQPPPPSRSIDPAATAWLSDQALTGLPRQELDSLVDQVADDWQMHLPPTTPPSASEAP
ncbi:hypothetical protein CLM62_29520 [Streptomyces sp. SA15]|uniref:hypothetical protein n=1 Tax=Streptomyces sp. SA15 TaxID=934019 RepID=UPI000BAFAEBF|nr:hypothetical protein [Streptomyces sp. SA15]PAZ12554.1 hypothetical protein CLM62_29520 [Streptomyces sp. SA15]